MTVQIDIPAVKTEVEAAFAEYERALVGNDVEALDRLFLKAPTTIRYGVGENLYGYDAIAAFRAGRSPAGLARALERTVITSLRHRLRHRRDTVSADAFTRQGRPANADVGQNARRLAGGCRACERDRRTLDLRFAEAARPTPSTRPSRTPP